MAHFYYLNLSLTDFQSLSVKFHLFPLLWLKALLALYSECMYRPWWRAIAFELFFCTSTVGTIPLGVKSGERAALKILCGPILDYDIFLHVDSGSENIVDTEQMLINNNIIKWI